MKKNKTIKSADDKQYILNRRKFLGILGTGAALSMVPINASLSGATDTNCGAVTKTVTVYFLNSNWGTVLQPAPYNHTACKGKACHFRNANTYYSSAQDAENSRLHLCCIAPVQSRTIALSASDITALKNGKISFDIREAQTLEKLKEIIAANNCTAPSNVTKSMIASVLNTEVSLPTKAQGVSPQAIAAGTPAENSAQGTLPFTGTTNADKLSLYGLTLASAGLLFAFKSRQNKEITD